MMAAPYQLSGAIWRPWGITNTTPFCTIYQMRNWPGRSLLLFMETVLSSTITMNILSWAGLVPSNLVGVAIAWSAGIPFQLYRKLKWLMMKIFGVKLKQRQKSNHHWDSPKESSWENNYRIFAPAVKIFLLWFLKLNVSSPHKPVWTQYHCLLGLLPPFFWSLEKNTFESLKQKETCEPYNASIQGVLACRSHHKVREEVNKTLADLVAWSIHHASLGAYPRTGFYGEQFDKNSFRHGLSGRPIAGGFKLLGMICAPKFKKWFLANTPWKHLWHGRLWQYICIHL